MKQSITIGYVGTGARGQSILQECLAKMRDVNVKTVCDLSEERMQKAADILVSAGRPAPHMTTDYTEILSDPDIDAVFYMNGWENRAEMAAKTLYAGKYCAIEVGCSYDIAECWDLIRAYEETGVPLMMLENCCYGRREMMALRMVKEGLFGEVVHCDGGYMHNCRHVFLPDTAPEGKPLEVEPGVPNFRLESMEKRNFHFYPTHDFGPIAKVLTINRGNRMLTLSSFASKSRGMAAAIAGKDTSSPYHGMDIKCGDIIDTIITCANGETVHLRLDTTLPRPFYSRGFTVRGTKGMCTEDTRTVFLDGMAETMSANEPEFFEKYDHPLHREYAQSESRGGHGGIDWLVCRAFVEAVKRGENTPIDAYDTVSWMAIGPLSETSIAHGGAPVDVPDFTRGRWLHREPVTRGKYCLDEICDDLLTPIFADL
ncbi:MAG: gfo/Idh/MocA family oxidoreductase [Clostridia bacterium]|nr:gfo/Idh/MocA family oxidoreductase [Clostridia bacterium]